MQVGMSAGDSLTAVVLQVPPPLTQRTHASRVTLRRAA